MQIVVTKPERKCDYAGIEERTVLKRKVSLMVNYELNAYDSESAPVEDCCLHDIGPSVS